MNVETQSARIIDAAANGGTVAGFEEVSVLLAELGTTTPVAPGAGLVAPGVAAAAAISKPGFVSAGVVFVIKAVTASCLLAGLIATGFVAGGGSAEAPAPVEAPGFDRSGSLADSDDEADSRSVPDVAREVQDPAEPAASPTTSATNFPNAGAAAPTTASPVPFVGPSTNASPVDPPPAGAATSTSMPAVPASTSAPPTSNPVAAPPIPADPDDHSADEPAPPPPLGNNGNGNSNGNGVGNGKGNNGKADDR